MIEVDKNIPLLIGKGVLPLVWLSAPLSKDKWEYIIERNISRNPLITVDLSKENKSVLFFIVVLSCSVGLLAARAKHAGSHRGRTRTIRGGTRRERTMSPQDNAHSGNVSLAHLILEQSKRGHPLADRSQARTPSRPHFFDGGFLVRPSCILPCCIRPNPFPRYWLRPSRHVLNLGSGAALLPFPGYPAYGPVKVGVLWLSEYQRAELGPLGVRVSCVCPLLVRTAMGAAGNVGATRQPDWMFHTPEHVARVIHRAIGSRRFLVYASSLLHLLHVLYRGAPWLMRAVLAGSTRSQAQARAGAGRPPA